MIRHHLRDLPEFALPPGFSLRWYCTGDEAAWLRIHLAAERERAIVPELFRSQFGHDEDILARRQGYLLDAQGNPIGTATAWLDENFMRRFAASGGSRCPGPNANWGRLHWVAIMPEFQDRGLARPLVAAACRRLCELGHECAFLRTTPTRIAAINLYLRFGFVPLPLSPEEAGLWKALAPRLKYVPMP